MDKRTLRRVILFPVVTALIYLPFHDRVKQNIKGHKEYNETKSFIELIADTDSIPGLSFKEQYKIYEACGVADSSSTYILTEEDMLRGLSNSDKLILGNK